MELSEQMLNEITLYCRDECCSSQECPEDECVLFRLERMVIDSESTYNRNIRESGRG